MGIGFSLFLIAVGAILTFAVHATLTGIDIAVVGVILMVVGFTGLLLSLLYMQEWFWFQRSQARGHVHDDAPDGPAHESRPH